MTKADKVRLLLLSMDSHLPDPKPPRVYASAEPGAQASYYARCNVCQGAGRMRGTAGCVQCREAKAGWERARYDALTAKTKVPPKPTDRHGCSLCPGCDGAGEKYVRHGERNYDPYSQKTLEELRSMPPVEGAHKPVRAVLRSSQPSERDFPWVEERKRMEAYGSYKELRECLEWLRDRHLPRFEMLSHWVSSRDDRFWSWSEEAEAAVNKTIEMLAEKMPHQVRYPGWLRKELSAA